MATYTITVFLFKRKVSFIIAYAEMLPYDDGNFMFIYGKTASNAIAVMSYLASRPGERLGSDEIARVRSISRPLTAKLLTRLASAGLVRGVPGPGGGYTLAKDSAMISFMQIVSLFEQITPPSVCPFGPNWCGNNDPCPLHDTLMEMLESNRAFLENTRLSIFSPSPASHV